MVVIELRIAEYSQHRRSLAVPPVDLDIYTGVEVFAHARCDWALGEKRSDHIPLRRRHASSPKTIRGSRVVAAEVGLEALSLQANAIAGKALKLGIRATYVDTGPVAPAGRLGYQIAPAS